MTCTAPRGKPYEKKDTYEGRTRQVMGRKTRMALLEKRTI